MDSDLKWVVGGFCLLIAMIAVSSGMQDYWENITARTAIEQGYVQTVDPQTRQVIWVKDPSQTER